MRFQFTRAISPSPGSLSISISSLSDTLDGSVRGAQTVNLSTQDSGAVLLFSGEAASIDTSYADGNRATILNAIDGDSFFSSFASFTLAAGNTLYQLLEACASRGTVPIPIGSYPAEMESIRLPRAVSVHGNAMQRIRQLAASIGAECFVQDGLLYVVGIEVATDLQTALTPDMGLVGTPTKTEYGAVFQTRMRPVALNRLVRIESDLLTGAYRVVSVTGNGDTQSGDWVCTHIGIDMASMPVKNSIIWR